MDLEEGLDKIYFSDRDRKRESEEKTERERKG